MAESILSDYYIDRRMIYDISKVVKKYKENKKRADVDFCNEVCDIFSKYNCINLNYVGAASFQDEFAGVCCGDIDELYINFSRLINIAKVHKDSSIDGHKYNFGDNNRLYNFLTLFTLLHELAHAKQFYVIKNSKDLNSEVYQFCSNLVVEENALYHLYHDTVPWERYADLFGFECATEVFDYVYKDKNSYAYRLYYLDALMSFYFDDPMGPLNQFSEGCDLNNYDRFDLLLNKLDKDELSLLERLFLGLPINQENLNKLEDIYCDYYDTLNEGNYNTLDYSVKMLCKRINE